LTPRFCRTIAWVSNGNDKNIIYDRKMNERDVRGACNDELASENVRLGSFQTIIISLVFAQAAPMSSSNLPGANKENKKGKLLGLSDDHVASSASYLPHQLKKKYFALASTPSSILFSAYCSISLYYLCVLSKAAAQRTGPLTF
jgi:hypothetical protein